MYNHDTKEEWEIDKELKAVINANYGLEALEYTYYPLNTRGGTGIGSLKGDGGEVYPTVTKHTICHIS